MVCNTHIYQPLRSPLGLQNISKEKNNCLIKTGADFDNMVDAGPWWQSNGIVLNIYILVKNQCLDKQIKLYLSNMLLTSAASASAFACDKRREEC
jgi:hypothetical protein